MEFGLYSVSPEMAWFDRLYHTCLFCTVSEILPYFYTFTWLLVTMKSPSVSIRLLKLQAKHAFPFVARAKYKVINTCMSYRCMGIRKCFNQLATFEVTQGHWYRCRSVSHIHMISCESSVVTMSLSCTVSDILSLRPICRNFSKLRDPELTLFGVDLWF